MAESEQKSTETKSNNRWSWDVPGFRKSPEHEAFQKPPPPPLTRRYSISAVSAAASAGAGVGAAPHSELYKYGLNSKLLKLKENIKVSNFSFFDDNLRSLSILSGVFV